VTAVAVLGLGAMGRAIAARLLDAGHDVRVWNRTTGRDEELVAAGARRADTPADAVGGAEVVITMVTDGAALEQVLFGDDGAASAISRNATLIDMSTVGPSAIVSVAERLAPVSVLDAPVLGSVP
jgi:3-hydroxyisobutyrate dehydrogenase-like beta-hydroxyacid dehydrogenase